MLTFHVSPVRSFSACLLSVYGLLLHHLSLLGLHHLSLLGLHHLLAWLHHHYGLLHDDNLCWERTVGLLLATDDDEDCAHDAYEKAEDGDDEAAAQGRSGDFAGHVGGIEDACNQVEKSRDAVENSRSGGHSGFASLTATTDPGDDTGHSGQEQGESQKTSGSTDRARRVLGR